MSGTSEFLWYIPNQVESGHRGDLAADNHNGLETLTSHLLPLLRH